MSVCTIPGDVKFDHSIEGDFFDVKVPFSLH